MSIWLFIHIVFRLCVKLLTGYRDEWGFLALLAVVLAFQLIHGMLIYYKINTNGNQDESGRR